MPPPLYYLAGLAIGFVIEWGLGGPLFPRHKAPGFWLVPGAGLIVVGLVLGIAAVITVHRSGSTIRVDRPATALVVRGPYRWTRNPIYLGLALVSAGIAVAANAIWPLLMLPVVITMVRRRVIEREEQYLEHTFGREYRRYRDRVPRWL
ncbi:MAG TPA: isoprenylcysteine carboxylmethyltransferase family protein [Gemmatimonadaceae bacterium]|jgi:protein-S-isoprenylcysteine O-methyltransferase Ste14|nr:isoprenylcysteine carboxylmethyltransferase family protein [Gemmatimonadaceae bacterium]